MDSSLECGPAGVEKGHFQIGEIAQMAGSALGQAERLYQTLSGGHCHIAEEEHKNFYASDIFYPTATASRHTFIAVARKARCVLAEIRWRWTLKVLYAAA